VRWYQAAAFQPFFRSHAHIDTKRREPWLFSETELKRIREAVRWRYSYLPLWYTLFYEGEQNGTPPMRPLWYEFPEDEASFKVDNEHMVGGSLLVRTISEQGVTGANVYFPGTNQIWYDIFTAQQITASGTVNVPISEERIPVYQRGGTVVPKKERIRRSSALMANDPYTLIVALDVNKSAKGTLYIDDGQSYEYREGKFIYLEFNFQNNRLTGNVKNTPKFESKSWLERVIVMGFESEPKQVKVITPLDGEQNLEFWYNDSTKVLTIRKPAVNIAAEFEIEIVV
jgi:alpha 1,3-glucosidase